MVLSALSLRRRSWLFLAALSPVIGPPLLANTILPFDFDPAETSENEDIGAYGSNEPGTQNVSVFSSTGLQAYYDWEGRTSCGQIDYNGSGGSPITITFTPDPGYGVLVTSFDIDEWTGGGNSVVDWTLEGGAVNLSGRWDALGDQGSGSTGGLLGLGSVGSTDGGRTTVVTGMTEQMAAASGGQPIVLTLTLVSGLPNYLAIDSLVFDQVVAGDAIFTVTDLEIDGDQVTLTWQSTGASFYSVWVSRDLVFWSENVDSIPAGALETTETITLDAGDVGADTLFFQVRTQ